MTGAAAFIAFLVLQRLAELILALVFFAGWYRRRRLSESASEWQTANRRS